MAWRTIPALALAALLLESRSPGGARVVTPDPAPSPVGTVERADGGRVRSGEVVAFGRAAASRDGASPPGPQDAPSYFDRGNARCEMKDYEKAIAEYDQAIRLDPKFAAAYNNRGFARHRKKDYEKAVADYDEAIRLDHGFAKAYHNRGYARSEMKDDEKAIADYDRAIALDPRQASTYLDRGNAWDRKKDYERATADYDEAIRLDPGYAMAYYNRGNVWNRRKAYEKAVADYDEAIRLDPKHAWALNNRAWLRATCPVGKYRDGKKAVESATKAVGLSGSKEAAHLGTLAAAYAESGDFARAVEWEAKANELYADAVSRKKGEERLKLYREKTPYRGAE